MRSPDSIQKNDIIDALKDIRRINDKNDAKVAFVTLLEVRIALNVPICHRNSVQFSAMHISSVS